MLRERRQFLASLLYLADLLVLAGSWSWAFELRFSGWPVPVVHGEPEFRGYLMPLLFIPLLWGLLFRYFKLYRPGAIESRTREAADVARAVAVVALGILSASYLAIKLDLSRVFLGYFAVLATINLIVIRVAYHTLVLQLRQRFGRLQRVLIVGTAEVARDLKRRIDGHPELGLDISGFVSSTRSSVVGSAVDGLPVLGEVNELRRIVAAAAIDVVFVAQPVTMPGQLEGILAQLSSEMVEIKIVPDLYRHALLRSTIEEFDGMPILSLDESPLTGWASVLKRALDLTLAPPLLLLCAPLMLGIAVGVRLTSGRPIFYVQERMGLDGRTFQLIKFRTMCVDAEKEIGPVWAAPDDARRTRFGAFLRRTNLDELPQLWHVIRGEMSLVGPRPERPVFIDEFRERLPSYMLRHRVKAGMTGWAQVNGWRGNTSIERRLDHDLDYIRNWSLTFDLKILWLTLIRGFSDRNAY